MGDIKLNGKPLTSYGCKDKKISDNKLMSVTYGNVSDMELPEEVDIKINIGWVDDIRGPWNFKFKISKAEGATNSKVINFDKTIKLPSSTLKIEKLVISPLGNTINYKGIFDNLNKNEFNDNGIYSFAVIDDKGREFFTIDNLNNAVIKVGENGKALIKDIEVTYKETKITFKLEGCGAYSFSKLIMLLP